MRWYDEGLFSISFCMPAAVTHRHGWLKTPRFLCSVEYLWNLRLPRHAQLQLHPDVIRCSSQLLNNALVWEALQSAITLIKTSSCMNKLLLIQLLWFIGWLSSYPLVLSSSLSTKSDLLTSDSHLRYSCFSPPFKLQCSAWDVTHCKPEQYDHRRWVANQYPRENTVSVTPM